MGTPKTLRERVDSIVEDLSGDNTLFSGVLGGLLEKKASAETPAKVLQIAAGIVKEIGVEKTAALKMAWQTYTKYVNPGFPMPKEFAEVGKEAKGKPPAFVQKMKEMKAKHQGKDGKKAEIKKEAFKSPAARVLAEKLGASKKAAPAPIKESKSQVKTAAGKKLLEGLGLLK